MSVLRVVGNSKGRRTMKELDLLFVLSLGQPKDHRELSVPAQTFRSGRVRRSSFLCRSGHPSRRDRPLTQSLSWLRYAPLTA